jgi:hypothetical protein
MSNKELNYLLRKELPVERSLDNTYCGLASGEHCITCSDEVQLVRVLQIDQEKQSALVMQEDTDRIEEIDISLVEAISLGDQLLIHGGVAIAHAD